MVQIDFYGSEDFLDALIIQNDSKIILAGHNNQSLNDTAMVSWLDTQGVIDVSSCSSGIVKFSLWQGNPFIVEDVLVMNNGQILINGRGWNINTY